MNVCIIVCFTCGQTADSTLTQFFLLNARDNYKSGDDVDGDDDGNDKVV